MLSESIVEYLSSKGSKRLAIVVEETSAGKVQQLDVMNDVEKEFSIPMSRVTHIVHGEYNFNTLLILKDRISSLKLQSVERIWEKVSPTRQEASLTDISQDVFDDPGPLGMFLASKLMERYGHIFFYSSRSGNGSLFRPKAPSTVQANLRDRAALHEFKQWFTKVSTTRAAHRSGAPYIYTTVPERVRQVLEDYEDGLKQLILGGHPWVSAGIARRQFDKEQIEKGKELLVFLELAPTVKNARKIMEMVGLWEPHTNAEKYVMALRDTFPAEVMEEAQYLSDNWQSLPDPDERLRRDLRYMRSYAIDREGATEIDDALSIETLEDGREKVWMHIADVSRWIRPGSGLSIEAERRMLSVYMPDEKISMFPDMLSTDLLSLGAHVDSYALSCGVTLDADGQVTSYEVCPSKITLKRRVSYQLLDEILNGDNDRSKDSAKMDKGERRGKMESLGSALTRELGSIGGSGGGPTPTQDPARHMGMSIGSSSSSSSNIASSVGTGGWLSTDMISDLKRLDAWAQVRYSHRVHAGSLDCFLRDKTDLSLSAKRSVDRSSNRAQRSPSGSMGMRYNVMAHMSWANASSTSLVSEYMILMCQTIGNICRSQESTKDAPPVWYKVQVPSPPLTPADLRLGDDEVPFLRAARIRSHLRAAEDSRTPGPHVTTGSETYVQCTSPIRRYHDLYNHYRLKAAMHGASMGEEWADRATEEAGICKLDSMATAQERLQTLSAIRMVTRHREKYWLRYYIERVVDGFDQAKGTSDNLESRSPLQSIDAVILGPVQSTPELDPRVGRLYEVLALQLGCMHRYHFFHPGSEVLAAGFIVKSKMTRMSSPQHTPSDGGDGSSGGGSNTSAKNQIKKKKGKKKSNHQTNMRFRNAHGGGRQLFRSGWSGYILYPADYPGGCDGLPDVLTSLSIGVSATAE